jgi:hypothetical protein
MNKFLGYLFFIQILSSALMAYEQVSFEHFNTMNAYYLQLDSTGGLKDLDYKLVVLFP